MPVYPGAQTYLSSFLGLNSDNLSAEEVLARRGLPPGARLDGSVHMDELQQSFYLSHRIEMTIEAFSQISHFVSAAPGRKNLTWLSAAFPVVIFPPGSDPFANAENYSPKLREVADLLTLSQVAVYPVDVRGLSPASPLNAANTHNYQHFGEYSGALYGAFLARAGEFQTMEQIAEDSGGHAFYNTNGLEHAMETALDDGSTYCTISYAPTNTKFDGRMHHIRVALETKSHHLSYRRTYLADDPDTLRERAEITPFGRSDASMQRSAPCAHEISFTAHMASEGFPQQVNHEQIRQLSYFAAFAGNKN